MLEENRSNSSRFKFANLAGLHGPENGLPCEERMGHRDLESQSSKKHVRKLLRNQSGPPRFIPTHASERNDDIGCMGHSFIPAGRQRRWGTKMNRPATSLRPSRLNRPAQPTPRAFPSAAEMYRNAAAARFSAPDTAPPALLVQAPW